jgi:hypothetical protein
MTNYLGPLVIAEGFSAKHRHRGRVPLQAGTNQQILPASLGDSEPCIEFHSMDDLDGNAAATRWLVRQQTENWRPQINL